LTNQKIIDGTFYPQYFTNSNKTPYNNYKYRANIKNIEFTLSEEEYNNITSLKCYLCGKESNYKHSNGIDRINNDIGYTEDNIACCCAECNYMKNNYQYDDFIEKLVRIYSNWKDKMINIEDVNESANRIIVKGNKKSKEERQEIFEKKKVEKRTELLSRYNNEEGKLERAKLIAERRVQCQTIQ
jgi:hypothetical protein